MRISTDGRQPMLQTFGIKGFGINLRSLSMIMGKQLSDYELIQPVARGLRSSEVRLRMNWNSGDDSKPFPPSYDMQSSVGGTLESPQTDLRINSTQSHEWSQHNGAGSSTDIQLLNDDHEKAILSDLCKTGGTESAPLTTFSYISEYICSNNIDIWPSELPSSSDASGKLSFGEHHLGDQRFPRASCMHQQIYSKCKRVLESVIGRNEQILALLRRKQSANKSLKRLL